MTSIVMCARASGTFQRFSWRASLYIYSRDLIWLAEASEIEFGPIFCCFSSSYHIKTVLISAVKFPERDLPKPESNTAIQKDNE